MLPRCSPCYYNRRRCRREALNLTKRPVWKCSFCTKVTFSNGPFLQASMPPRSYYHDRTKQPVWGGSLCTKSAPPLRGYGGVVGGAIPPKLAGNVQGTCLDSPASSERPISHRLAPRRIPKPRTPPGAPGGSREGVETRHRSHSKRTDETYSPVPHSPRSEQGGPSNSTSIDDNSKGGSRGAGGNGSEPFPTRRKAWRLATGPIGSPRTLPTRPYLAGPNPSRGGRAIRSPSWARIHEW